MNDIWNALVKDSNATLDKHFEAIMEDLLLNILGREWRVRQAACAAVADLVQGRSIEKVTKNKQPPCRMLQLTKRIVRAVPRTNMDGVFQSPG